MRIFINNRNGYKNIDEHDSNFISIIVLSGRKINARIGVKYFEEVS